MKKCDERGMTEDKDGMKGLRPLHTFTPSQFLTFFPLINPINHLE
jgi:hypothetical protein